MYLGHDTTEDEPWSDSICDVPVFIYFFISGYGLVIFFISFVFIIFRVLGISYFSYDTRRTYAWVVTKD